MAGVGASGGVGVGGSSKGIPVLKSLNTSLSCGTALRISNQTILFCHSELHTHKFRIVALASSPVRLNLPGVLGCYTNSGRFKRSVNRG